MVLKKTNFILSILLLCVVSNGHTQNLVQNHDFSQINNNALLDRRWNSSQWQIPPGPGTWTHANDYTDGFVHWFTPPEYGYPSWQNRNQWSYFPHHQNAPYAPVDTVYPYIMLDPNCTIWKTYPLPAPKEGDGYAALSLMDTVYMHNYSNWGNYPNPNPCPPMGPLNGTNYNNQPIYHPRSRCFMETLLLYPLDADSTYTIEFYTNRRAWAHYTTADISAYCSSDTFKYEDFRLQTITPQASATDSVYSDWNNYNTWTHVKGSFVAQGGEQFLTLGNFKQYQSPKYVWCNPMPDTNFRRHFGEITFTEYYFDAVYLYKSRDTVFEVNLPNDTTLCAGDSLTLYANHTNTFKLLATKTFLWSTGSTDSSITIGSPGTYWVEVAYNNRWKQYDTIVVDYYPQYPGHNLPTDTTLCAGQSLVLNVPAQDSVTHLWSTGITTSTATFNSAGQYWVQSISPCDTFVDTINIAIEPLYNANLPTDTIICINQSVALFATQNPNVTYTWSNGSTTNTAVYFEPGTATLNVQTPCGPQTYQTQIAQSDCNPTNIWIPNAFTPDGDGTNDYFEIFGVPEPVTLHVFNRWGERVYFSNNYQNDWDGTYKGELLSSDVYTYLIEYKFINANATQPNPSGSERQIRGSVTLIR